MATCEFAEAVIPMNRADYAKTFQTYLKRCTQYDAMMIIARKLIQNKTLDERPVKMLSIGAGTGHFEVFKRVFFYEKQLPKGFFSQSVRQSYLFLLSCKIYTYDKCTKEDCRYFRKYR